MHPVFMLLRKVCRNHSYEMENGTTALRPSSRFYAFCDAGSKSELLADQFYGVEFLPAEILDLPFDFVSVAPKLFGAGIRTIAEVAVGGRRLEDRVRQAEPFDDRRRTQVLLGEKVVVVVPAVMPFWLAQRMAL